MPVVDPVHLYVAGYGSCDSGPGAQDCCPLSCWPGPYWVSTLHSLMVKNVVHWLRRSVELQATVCRLTLVPASFMLPGVIVEHGG